MLETLPATPAPWVPVVTPAPLVQSMPTRLPKATPHHGTFARGSEAELSAPPVALAPTPVQRDSNVVATVRFLTVAACLFGLGFVGALVLWSV
jgi:hypothetical protein